MDKPEETEFKSEEELNRQITRRTAISFAGFIGLYGLAYGSWRWLYASAKEEKGITAGARKPLRKALNKTELAFRRIFSNNHLVKTYPKSMAAKNVRINSHIGIENVVDVNDWKLSVKTASGKTRTFSMDEIKALPKTEIIYDFKCVEGWDQISHWGGVKFVDFIKHFKLERETQLQHAGFSTPDKKYYVGLDMPSALHPQTLLAYEMNDKPLGQAHGAPLRLIIPVKYGIKNLKRIGTINFSNQRLPDYWAERGYDYYSGL